MKNKDILLIGVGELGNKLFDELNKRGDTTNRLLLGNKESYKYSGEYPYLDLSGSYNWSAGFEGEILARINEQKIRGIIKSCFEESEDIE